CRDLEDAQARERERQEFLDAGLVEVGQMADLGLLPRIVAIEHAVFVPREEWLGVRLEECELEAWDVDWAARLAVVVHLVALGSHYRRLDGDRLDLLHPGTRLLIAIDREAEVARVPHLLLHVGQGLDL